MRWLGGCRVVGCAAPSSAWHETNSCPVLPLASSSDYDLDGAAGVGSAGGLAVARHLLQGDADDSAVLERLAAAVRVSRREEARHAGQQLTRLARALSCSGRCAALPQRPRSAQHPTMQRPPDAELLSLTKCTGCASCGHEGGRLNKIKRHSSRNPCACCPPAADGHCPAVAFDRCGCVFHARETERRVSRLGWQPQSCPPWKPALCTPGAVGVQWQRLISSPKRSTLLLLSLTLLRSSAFWSACGATPPS